MLFLRAARRPDFRWSELARPLLPVALLGAAMVANAYPTIFRAYPTETPASTFLFIAAISFAVQWLLLLGAAAIAFVLFSSARPGWRRALRTQGGLGDALLRAAIATAGLAALSRLGTIAAQRVPQLFRADPSLPNSLERAFPSLAVIGSAASQLASFGLASVVAGGGAGWRGSGFPPPGHPGRDRCSGPRSRFFRLRPISPWSSRLRARAGSLAILAWLASSARFVLLADHPAAWVFFGTLAFGLAAAVRLLSQPAPPDRISRAAVGILLTAVGASAPCRVPARGSPRWKVSARPPRRSRPVKRARAGSGVASPAPPSRPRRLARLGRPASGRRRRARSRARIPRGTRSRDRARARRPALPSQRRVGHREHREERGRRRGGLLERRGIRPELLRVPGAPPVVFGELATPGARRTLVLYAHYDGQPVGPEGLGGRPVEARSCATGRSSPAAARSRSRAFARRFRRNGGSTAGPRATTRRRSSGFSPRSTPSAPPESRRRST